MKDPLKKCTIAVSGDFGKARTMDKLRQWIEMNGGTFATKIDCNVTHLVCSKEHYKKSVAIVQQVRKVKKIKIVTYDWLEDSLLKRYKIRETGEYLLATLIKAKTKEKQRKRANREQKVRAGMEKFESDTNEFKKTMHRDGYSIYHDPDGFAYDIPLIRVDPSTNQYERFDIKLFESHEEPKYYSCYAKYRSPMSTNSTQVLALPCSDMKQAFASFKEFFKEKTKKEWEQRAVDLDGGQEQAFVYVPPKAGLPQGDYFENQNALAIAEFVQMLKENQDQSQVADLLPSDYVR